MREFKDFTKSSWVKKKKKDISKAKSLVEIAENRKKVMEKYLPLNNETVVQVMEECYDIIRELLEAKLSREGYKTYSHEAIVSYLKELGFSKDKVAFLDNLRMVRHGTLYYGKSVDLEYVKEVRKFMEEIYPQLKKIAEE